MKKRLSVFLLAMVMILSVCPAVNVAAATTTDSVILYDAYISGNMVVGETLTANYSIYPKDCDINTELTDASIQWYAVNRYGTSSSTKVVELGTGKTYSVPTNYHHTASDSTDTTILDNPNAHYIFFTVTPKADDGTDMGDMAYSNLGKHIVAADTTEAPAAFNATIVPQNANGSMTVGDTLVARYSYQEPSGIDESGSLYAWYTRDSLESERVLVQEESTNNTYELKAADVGKWIEVDVIPVSVSGKQGTKVTTKNHYGNVFYTNGAKLLTSNKFYGTKYNSVRMMADGNQYTSATVSRTSAGYFLCSSATVYHTETGDTTSDAYVVFDMGRCVPFDGVYVKRAMQDVPILEISYSQYNGDITSSTLADAEWENIVSVERPNKEAEYTTDSVKYARYFKIKAKSTSDANFPKDADIMDFYAFRRSDSRITHDESFAEIENDKLILSAWSTPKKAIEDAIISDSGADVTINFVDADGKEITEDFVVDENLTNTYVEFKVGEGIPTNFKVEYRGDIVNTPDSKSLSQGIHIVSDKTFEGGKNGKMRIAYKVYVPEGCQPYTNIYMNGTKWGTGIAAIQYPILFADDSFINYKLNVSGGAISKYFPTEYKYTKNKWHDVEIILDYSTAKLSGTLGYLDIYVWVDGVLVSEENRDFNTPKGFRNDHIDVLVSGFGSVFKSPTTDESIQISDVNFREMYEIKSLVTPPETTLSLMDGDTAADAIAENKTYTMADDLKVYHSETVNYLATYDVTYDGDTEISRKLVALDAVAKADAETATVTLGTVSVTNDDGTVTKKEVKAFSFTPDMIANAQAGIWKAE